MSAATTPRGRPAYPRGHAKTTRQERAGHAARSQTRLVLSVLELRAERRQDEMAMVSTGIQTATGRPLAEGLGTMQAAVVEDFTKPLAVKEIPVPLPGPGEILVKIETSGLCHTDIHAARGHWPIKPKLPLIPGHEGVGIVQLRGPGVTEVKEGDRVGLPWLGYACGACEYCASGWETLCQKQLNTGYFIDGGYAQYAVANAKFVGKVPDGIDPLDAAPLTCAGVTTYKAVKVSGARQSDLVAVFGIGGLGHLALQYAKAAGAAAVAVEPRAFEQAYRSLRRGGTLVFVALPQDNFVQVPIFETVLNGIHIAGSIVGTRVDLQETYELHKMGKTRVIRETIKLDDVNHAFEEVEQGRVKARLVFDLR